MDLAERQAGLQVSLGNAVLNVRQAERDLAEAQGDEERVRGALMLIGELIAEAVVPIEDVGGSLRGVPETGEGNDG